MTTTALRTNTSATTTETLTAALGLLLAKGTLDAAERLVESSIVEELCSRIPALDAALDAWFMDLDSPFQSSGEVVLAALI